MRGAALLFISTKKAAKSDEIGLAALVFPLFKKGDSL
jgi:hypothetical protein